MSPKSEYLVSLSLFSPLSRTPRNSTDEIFYEVGISRERLINAKDDTTITSS